MAKNASVLCPLATKIDKDISACCKDQRLYSPQLIAYQRVLYMEAHPKSKVDWKNAEAAARILQKEEQKRYKRDSIEAMQGVKQIERLNTNLYLAYEQESPANTMQRVTQRVEMIANKITEIVSLAQEDYKNVPRKDLLKGTYVNGSFVGGLEYFLQAAKFDVASDLLNMKKELQKVLNKSNLDFTVEKLLEMDTDSLYDVQDSILDEMEEQQIDNSNADSIYDYVEVIKKLQRVLDQWIPLSIRARKIIAAREDVNPKVNIKNKLEDASEEEMSQGFDYMGDDAEEMTKGDVHDDKAKKHPKGMLTSEIRALCQQIISIDPETGEPATDDLGYKVFLPEKEVHDNLKTILQGVQNHQEIINRLQSAADGGNSVAYSILQHINDIIDNTKREELIGQLLVSFNTALENPSGYNTKKGTKWDPSNNYKRAAKRFFEIVTNNMSKLPKNSFFETQLMNKGKFKQKRFEEFMNLYLSTFARTPIETTEDGIKTYKYTGIRPFMQQLSRINTANTQTIGELKNQLQDLLTGLGIKVDDNTLALLLTTAYGKQQLNRIFDQITRLVNFGLLKYYKDVASEVGQAGNLDIKVQTVGNKATYKPISLTEDVAIFSKLNFIDFLNSKGAKSDYIAKKVYEDLNTLLEEFNPKSRTFNYRYLDRNGKKATYYRTVATSHLYQVQDQINYYVAAQDAEGFVKWLYDEWLSNPLVCEIENKPSVYNRGDSIKVTKFYNNLIKELYEAAVTNEGNISIPRFVDKCEDRNSILNNFTFHKGLGSTTKKFSDMSEYEHLDMILLDYFGNIDNNNPRYTNIPVFILGDANAYKNMLGIRYNSTKNKNSFDVAVNKLYDTFLMEQKKFELIDNLSSEDNDIIINNFSKHKNVFTELPFLNPTFENGKYAVDFNDPNTLTESEVKRRITQYLNDRIDYYLQDFINKGLLTKNEEKNTYIPNKVLKKKLNNISSQNFYTEAAMRTIIQDMYITLKLNLIDQLNMLDGTTAFYKNVKDLQKRNKQLHSSGLFLDLEAKYYNSNEYVLDQHDQSQHCLYFKDPKLDITTNEDYKKLYNLLQNMWKKQGLTQREVNKRLKQFREITVTDGQGYRTLDSYRDVMLMSHQWNDELENIYNEIKRLGQAIKDIKNNIINESKETDENSIQKLRLKIANLAVSFKPIKPFTYAFETITLADGSIVKVPTQHKYAEAILIPELMPENSKLKDLAEWADQKQTIEYEDGTIIERRNADLLISEEGVKVGGFNITDLTEASGVKSKEDLLRRLNGDEANGVKKPWIHKIPYKGYRIQTNTTDHMYESTLYGTQARKLWYNGIKTDGSRSYNSYINGGAVMLDTKDGKLRETDCSNGSDLIKFYNQLIQANLVDSFNELKKLLKPDGNGKKIQELLIDGALSNSRQTMQSLENYMLTQDEKFLIPLFTPTISRDAQGLILSIFKKAVNKQKIAGGAAIQVSPTSLNDYRDAGDLHFITDYAGENVLYGECIIPFDLKISTANGKTFRLDYGTYCNTDGTLKFGRWATEEEIESGMWQSYEIDGKQFIPLIEEHYPGILDVVAKRIPTERNYSMLRLKVKRFSTMAEGPTIKVPAEGTLLAGFDYDIDKLFLMRKQFKAKAFTEEQMSEIWNDFYIAHPEIKDALVSSLGQTGASNFGKQLLNTILTAGESPLELQDRLYKQWDKAGLPGTYSHAIETFISQNLNKYINRGGEKTKFKQNMFEEYDTTLSPRQNSVTARNNMLFQLFSKRLEDSETLESRFTPGGFFNASDAAKAIRELMYGNFKVQSGSLETAYSQLLSKVTEDGWKDPEPEYDYSELSTILYYNKQNQIADKEIGVFANHNITHAFLYNFDVCELRNAIAIGEHCDTGLKDLIQRNDDKARQYSELMIAELLAASVDAVKDPVLNYLNINTYTANVAALLARLGYSMLEIGLFLNQPIVKDFVDRCDKKGLNSDIIKQEMESEILKNSGDRLDLSKGMSQYKQYLNTEALIKGVQHNNTTKQQSVVFQVFTTLLGQASSLSDITTATKMSASNSVGSNLAFFANQVHAIDAINESFRKKDSNIIIKVGDKGYLLSKDYDITADNYYTHVCEDNAGLEQTFYDTNIGILKLLKPYFPQADTKGVFGRLTNFLKEASYNDKLSENIINFLFTDFFSYIQASSGNSYFNPRTKVVPLNTIGISNNKMDAATYFREQFVQDYIEFRNKFNADEWNKLCSYYPILETLTTSSSALLQQDEIDNTEVTKSSTYNSIYISRHSLPSSFSDEAIEASWIDMARLRASDIFYSEKDQPDPETPYNELNRDEQIARREWDRAIELNTLVKNVLPKLAKYLVYYSYHTTGNTVQTTSFLYDAPAEILNRLNDGLQTGDLDYLQTLYSTLGQNGQPGVYDNMSSDAIKDFFIYFLRNHSDVYQFTRNLYDETDRKRLQFLYRDNNGFKNSFIVSAKTFSDMSDGDNLAAYFFRKDPDTKDTIKFYPAIKIDDNLYIAQPKNNKGTVSYKTNIDSEILYVRYDLLGESDKYSRYYDYESTKPRESTKEIDYSEYTYPEVMEDVLNYVYILKEELENNSITYDEKFLQDVALNVAQLFAGVHPKYSRPGASPFQALLEEAEDGIATKQDVVTGLSETLYDFLLNEDILTKTTPNAFTKQLYQDLSIFGKSDILQSMINEITEANESVYTLDETGTKIKLCE